MSSEGLLVIIVLAFTGFMIFRIIEAAQASNRAAEQRRQRAEAQLVESGHKPVGKPMGKAYGSAYLLASDQIRNEGLGFSRDELYRRRKTGELGFLLLGEVGSWKKSPKHPIDFSYPVLHGPGHAITIAPTRTGKGTSAVIPNLLNYTGSVIINDIKGENYAVTEIWRRFVNQDVYKLSPFEDETDSWNPFDVLAESEDPWDDARHMAELLIIDAPGKDEFWSNGARNLLTSFILHIATTMDAEKRTLSHLRELITQDQEEFELTLAEMGASKNKVVARGANVFQRADAKVQSGILSTLDSDLGFLDSERLARCTGRSDFTFKEMKEKKVSVYLIVPPERLRTYAAFIRLFMGMATLELKRTKTKPEYPVLIMLDEFPALGRMKVIEHEISYLAGYDVRLWLFAQDLKQLASIYGDGVQSIIANCKVKQFFGVSDYDTAKLVSLMCGDTTVPSISVSSSTGLEVGNMTENIGNRGRPLYDPNEVMNLPKGDQLIFFQGHQPIQAMKIQYFNADGLFVHEGQKLYSENPYHG